jgi:hypothetical protein
MTDAGAKEADQDRPLEHLLDEAAESGRGGTVTLDALLDHLGSRSFGPLLCLFGLVALVPPVSGIPGVPTAMGVLSGLTGAQLLFGADHLWIPAFIRKRGVAATKVAKMRDRGKGIARKVDALVGPRLGWATGGAGQRLAALAIILLAALMPPLELLPFAAALPAAGILLFGLALTACDGLLMLLGYAIAVAAGWLVGSQLLS